ncbi:WecB/TagA/CpsF family glycosyltransferase [Methylobacterium gnaphalii]|uniref:Glycosyl transferase n=1 Tax=Methylobacterium gnaphalii TaxID=1010610 RepID=A0A512JNR5_9HYPH|nr:WecB/TagA/CpsF family glycosyltransferase [Methylobacterium gnaphalii]GEP11601.1 glycosyl transferase [Methylobacterium gnaphalii]GJD69596.1 N-acetylglucosaminyldiphosphoundecaprenol N-acetyl-beta-D-mannosaminyltransferase [Methylobacterium gnaphalii]GLS49136.1 glycosyl transferase [Methylobacterium gnaphalii]
MSTSAFPPRVDILGVGVSAIDLKDAVATIDRWIRQRQKHFVCITGVHGVMECRRDSDLRGIHHAAGMVTPDGMPLVWMARRLGFDRVSRVYGPDLMREVSRLSPERGYRHFYFGGGPGLAQTLEASLRETYPGIDVVGTLSPPFRPVTEEEDNAIVEAINAAKPDIVWVGLSTPKQERWMSAHRDRIEAPVMIGVGAAFDFLAGTKRQAPRWMQRNGLEWAFRLASEPRRLGRRYATIVPRFLILAGAQLALTRGRAVRT